MASREQIKRNLLETIKKIDNIFDKYGIFDLPQEEQLEFVDRVVQRVVAAKQKALKKAQ